MIIRRCEVKDILNQKEKIFDLFEECLDSSFRVGSGKEKFINCKIQDLIYYLERNAVVYIATDENEIVGFVWAYINENGFDKRFHIAYISVFEWARGLGIGKLLMKEIEKEAQRQKIKNIELNVSSANKNALNFYKKIEFYPERILLVKEVKQKDE